MLKIFFEKHYTMKQIESYQDYNKSILIRCTKWQIFDIWHTKYQKQSIMRCVKCVKILRHATIHSHLWHSIDENANFLIFIYSTFLSLLSLWHLIHSLILSSSPSILPTFDSLSQPLHQSFQSDIDNQEPKPCQRPIKLRHRPPCSSPKVWSRQSLLWTCRQLLLWSH